MARPRRTTSPCGRSGSGPDFDFEPLDHLELGQRHGWIEMEAAAEPLRLPLRLPARRPRDARARPDPLRRRAGPGRGLRADRPPGARPRARPLRHRDFPGRARDDLRGPEGRALPRRHLRGLTRLAARRPDHGGGGPTQALRAASRPASGARPERPAATPGASSASTSSTRSRCSASSSPDGVRRGARTAARDPGANPHRPRDPLPGGRHRGGRPRRSRRPQVRLRGLDSEPEPLPGGDKLLRTPPTTRQDACPAGTVPRKENPRNLCTL